MRTVFIAAALALLFGSFAHAEVRKDGVSLKPTRTDSCVSIPSGWSHTELPAVPSVDCCDANGHCAQYISTEALLRHRTDGRT
jgi:hypothetical protein